LHLSCRIEIASIPTIKKANWIFTKPTINRQGEEMKLHTPIVLSWRSALAAVLTALWLLSSAYAQAPAKPKSIWQIQKVPLKGLLAVGVSADSANDVWVVGNGSLHFDGKTWTQIPIAQETGNPDLVLNSVAALSPSNVWAVGFFENSKGFDTEVIQHFDGKAWRNVKDLNLVGKQVDNGTVLSEALVSIAALSPTDLWAAGYLLEQSGTQQFLVPFIEHFNGKKWSLSGAPFATGNDLLIGVNGIAPISDKDVWMTAFDDINGQDGQGEIFHFDGRTWSLSATADAGASTFRAVAAISSGDVWAVGDQNDLQNTLIEHFDGNQWTVIPSPTPANTQVVELWGVTAISSKDVWASGFQEGFDGKNSPLVLHWDGKKWSVVPAPSEGTRSTTTFGIASVAPGDVWVAGSFLSNHQPFEQPFVLFTNQAK
jgi:hypothetical protein